MSLDWHDLALCSGMDTNVFFNEYEEDANSATIIDAMCNSCPVREACETTGMLGKEHGCWGGVYLKDGKPDKKFNAHKSDEEWRQALERWSTLVAK